MEEGLGFYATFIVTPPPRCPSSPTWLPAYYDSQNGTTGWLSSDYHIQQTLADFDPTYVDRDTYVKSMRKYSAMSSCQWAVQLPGPTWKLRVQIIFMETEASGQYKKSDSLKVLVAASTASNISEAQAWAGNIVDAQPAVISPGTDGKWSNAMSVKSQFIALAMYRMHMAVTHLITLSETCRNHTEACMDCQPAVLTWRPCFAAACYRVGAVPFYIRWLHSEAGVPPHL